ncbi:hypothetical protein BCR33DRAFT_717008 [Rhizoclosmatium globosum]|uniref:Uncharacterized protein n=1 Tax=Rhizoclosmatium globosum TaxID=329046 RepID=A0A1Y2CBT6_9FUNG|nr:hypothetical protein BCR33DRAFT_717008 [Rhizoclosmatium globosum]|eukprot:ORY44503.1 hypothetical protein BCR33DRAFT_717008 [Rhizoclosmatium globosum]
MVSRRESQLSFITVPPQSSIPEFQNILFLCNDFLQMPSAFSWTLQHLNVFPHDNVMMIVLIETESERETVQCSSPLHVTTVWF